MVILESYKKQPLVSVIVNCFNGEKYLRECLNSILKQTYHNWELIFWNNRSTDKSKEIFKEFEDKRFRYHLTATHTFLYEARDLAIKSSSGNFFTFCDVYEQHKSAKTNPYQNSTLIPNLASESRKIIDRAPCFCTWTNMRFTAAAISLDSDEQKNKQNHKLL